MSPSPQPSATPFPTPSVPPDTERTRPASLAELERLGNDTLFARSRAAACGERAANADLVCALAVLHRRRACARYSFGDIWGFLREELGYPKDQATRRSAAAKLLADFPEAEPSLRSGALSMSSFRALGELLRFVRDLSGHEASDEERSARVARVLEEAEGLTVREVKEMVKAELPSPWAKELQVVPFGDKLMDPSGREVEAGTSPGLERGASEPTGECGAKRHGAGPEGTRRASDRREGVNMS